MRSAAGGDARLAVQLAKTIIRNMYIYICIYNNIHLHIHIHIHLRTECNGVTLTTQHSEGGREDDQATPSPFWLKASTV